MSHRLNYLDFMNLIQIILRVMIDKALETAPKLNNAKVIIKSDVKQQYYDNGWR